MDLLLKHAGKVFCFVFMAVFLYLSFIGFFTFDRSTSFGDIFIYLIMTVGILFFGYVIIMFLAMPIYIGITQAKEKKSPLGKITSFLFGVIVTVFILDAILGKGIYLIEPGFKFVTSGTVKGTYWNCDDWTSAEDTDYDGNTITHRWCDDD